MEIGKRTKRTSNVYVRVMHYDSTAPKKATFVDGFTVYDAEPSKVVAIMKKALEKAAANGKR